MFVFLYYYKYSPSEKSGELMLRNRNSFSNGYFIPINTEFWLTSNIRSNNDDYHTDPHWLSWK